MLTHACLCSHPQGYFSCLQTTIASMVSHELVVIVPHIPSVHSSTLPSCALLPPLRRMSPGVQLDRL